MLRLLLLANTIYEYGIAFGAFFLLDQPTLAGYAVGLGTLSLTMLRGRDPDGGRPGLVALAVFHSAITLVWLIDALGGSFNPVLIVHLLFAEFFILALVRR